MVKVYNIYRVKTDISIMFTVMSGLDLQMIIELEDDLNQCFIYNIVEVYFNYLFVS